MSNLFAAMTSELCNHHVQKYTLVIMIISSVFLMGSCANIFVYPKLLESRKDGGSLVLQVHPGFTLTLERSKIMARDIYIQSSSLEYSGRAVQGILNLQQRIAPVARTYHPSDKNIPHQILEIQERSLSTPETDDSEYAAGKDAMPADPVTTVPFSEKTNAPRNVPDIFVVETCIVASANYTSYFNTTEDLALYFGAMLNSAGLVFAGMKNPDVKFQLNAVLNISDEKLFGNRVCGAAKNWVTKKLNTTVCGFDAEETLNRTTDYVNFCILVDCDIIYHITNEELTFIENDTLSPDITGYAKIGGACTRLKYGIGEDKPHTYTGLMTMIHEIGHLLGANHDGLSDTVACPAIYGNLMSVLHRGVQNKSKLSPCTQDAIRNYVRNLTSECINISANSNFTNTAYPGQNLSKDAYCKLLFPNEQAVEASIAKEYECEIECCWNNTDYLESRSDSQTADDDYGVTEESSTDGYDYFIGPTCRFIDMLDGMSCGDNKTCKAGVCGEHGWEPTRKEQ
uniref:Reprolysin n=1 Tax=Rhipicephalus zambeziensis TaxID=60191 RepID=A0A224YEK5_9ACAR